MFLNEPRLRTQKSPIKNSNTERCLRIHPPTYLLLNLGCIYSFRDPKNVKLKILVNIWDSHPNIHLSFIDFIAYIFLSYGC